MKTLAYLDAGTGSMLIQAILGGTAGLIVFLKTTGRRLFRRNRASSTNES
jgi:hypothetical protein